LLFMLACFVGSLGTTITNDVYKSQVEDIYRQHNPAKLRDVPTIMAKYADNPELLLRRLAHRYKAQVDATPKLDVVQQTVKSLFATIDEEVVKLQNAGHVVPALGLLRDVDSEVKRRLMNAQTRVRMQQLTGDHVVDDPKAEVEAHSNNIPRSCTDGLTNHLETGVDCGGDICHSCLAGQGCMLDTDCSSGVCRSSICTESSEDDVNVLQDQNAKLSEELSLLKQKNGSGRTRPAGK